MNKFLIAAIAALVCGSAQADNDDKGVIFGVGAGRLGVTIDALKFDDDVGSFKAFAGWRFNKYFAVEAAYVDPQEATQTYGESLKIAVDPTFYQASLVGTVWFNDSISLFGRAGNNWYEADGMVTDGVTTIHTQDSGNEFGWGVGLGAIWDRALFRLEYEVIDADLFDTTALSLSVAWRM